MVWANLIVLGLGGALLTLPVILHFLMQPKPKVLEFPALKFVRKREFTNRTRVRLRHFVLLLMRCLLILLMAAALAGPSVASREFGQWVTLGGVGVSGLLVALALAMVLLHPEKRKSWLAGIMAAVLVGHLLYGAWAGYQLMTSPSAQLIGDSESPISALIVVDTSARMGYKYENQTNLERAQEFSRWLIDQFPSDSQVCVLGTDNDAPFYSVDVGAARNRIGNLDIDYAAVSIPDRLSKAVSLFDDALHERKEIYLVTDLTRRSWEATRSDLLKTLELEESLSLYVVDVGAPDVSNFSLAPLTVEPQTLTPGGGFKVATSVSRIGSATQRNIRLRLERPDNTRPVVRDRKVLVPEQFIERNSLVDIPFNGTLPVDFNFSEKLPFGTHHGTIEIVGDDSLAVDNQRFFTIEVRPTWEVLVVKGRDVTPDNLTEALVDEADLSLFQCTVVEQNALPSRLDKFDAVFFLDPEPGISDTTWGALRKYVANGRGLGFFLGANAASGAFGHETFQSPAAQTILTGKLSRQWRRPDAGLFLSPGNLTHPIFAPFREWDTAVPWNQFPVFIHWGLEADEQWSELPTQTILQYGNGMPAIVERQIGEGRVLIMTTPITESANISGRDTWNELFTGLPLPAWLLVKQMSEHLVQSQSDRLNLSIGQMAAMKNDIRAYPSEYRIFTPRTTGTPEKIVATENSVRYRFTTSPGHYRLKGSLNEPVLRGFSVNLADGETDLTRIDPASLDAVLGADRYQLATKRDELQRQQGSMRRGQEFYPLLLLMLVVLLGTEYLLSNRFYS